MRRSRRPSSSSRTTVRAIRRLFHDAADPDALVLVGVDIGTQSLKVVITNDRLEPKGSARRAYEPSFPQPGWAEQDPALWEAALKPAIAAALADANARPEEIGGI